MKIVIGLLEESIDKASEYETKGYHIEHINTHVKNVAQGMGFDVDNLDKDQLQAMRDSALKLGPNFWVNIAIMACKDKDKIVIAGLQEVDSKRPFSKVC